jgi:8-oxo-dGTP pyrophosphatase MutT (NUDIX family)
MKFDEFQSITERFAQTPIPGEDAHAQVFPDIAKFRKEALRKNPTPRLSAVGAIFLPVHSETHLLLIERQSYDGVHSGQIGFPGGKIEKEDNDLEETARRETEEEVGVNRDTLQRLGHLSEVYIPPSGFLVKPYIFQLTEMPQLVPDPREVRSILTLPISRLLMPEVFEEGIVSAGNGTKIKTKYIMHEDKKIWGATAMMLSELKVLLHQITHAK